MSPMPEAKTGAPNIQDVFLNYARREKLPVVIHLLDGREFEVRIKNFDRFALIVDHAGMDHLIFKHAIATIRTANSRQDRVTGAEITRTMNEHIFSDQEHKEPTNVSRALRKPTLRHQRWLVVEGVEQQWRYGLAENWGKEWLSTFGSPAPDVRRATPASSTRGRPRRH